MMSSHVSSLLLILVLVGTALLPGCATNKGAERPPAKNAAVFVEGRHRGVTPATINVYRNRGEYEVVLKQGETVVRKYEIGIGGEQRGPERHLIDMDLERDHGGIGLRTFGLDDFESSDDIVYVIPYIANPIAIDDGEFGLILVIED